MMFRICDSTASRVRLPVVVLLAAIVTAGFAQWDPEQRVTSNTSVPDLTTTGNARAVAINGSVVQLVYHEQPSLFQATVYHTRSTDNGASWSSRCTLSSTGAFLTAMFGTVAVSGNTVHTAWMELNLLSGLSSLKYRRSTDAGATWLATQTITSTGTLNEVPSLAVDGSNVHLVWDDAGNMLYYRRSTDAGANWGTTLNLSTSAATGCVAASGSTVLVSYSVGAGSSWDIYLRRSTDGGTSFGTAVLIENAGSNADISSLALQGSNAVIVWYDNGNVTYDVRYRRSTDGGAIWTATAALAGGAGSQEAPCVAVGSAGQLNAVYEDDSYGNYEIAHKYSTDWGVSWSTAYRVTTASNTSQRPTVAMTGPNTVAVAWTDGRYSEANPDVFFRRGVIQSGVTHDVGVSRILAPSDTVDSGMTITPACSVRNYGSQSETYRVRMRIGAGYDESTQVAAHLQGTDRYVTFPNWPALQRGANPVTCSTRLAGDAQPSNDRATGSVFVRVRDAEALSIDAPTSPVDSGTTVPVRATVRNNGTGSATFQVRFDITGTGYTSTQTVSLASGAQQQVSFANWTANVARGSYALRCTTMLSGDLRTANDLRTGQVTMRVADAEVLSIDVPAGTADSGVPVAPRGTVRNNGTDPASFNVRFSIGSWTNTKPASLAAGAQVQVVFDPWTPPTRGTFAMKCTTLLPGDLRTANDYRTGSVVVNVHDVGVTAVTSPLDTNPPGPLVPSATARNYGTLREPLKVLFAVNSSPSYRESLLLTAGLPFSDTTLSFPSWTAPSGTFTARCSSALASDQNHANDLKTRDFVVGTRDVGVSAIPAPSGTFDTSLVVQPSARVRNFGILPAPGFKVFFRIDSGVGLAVFRDSMTIPGLAVGDSVTPVFAEWPKPHHPRSYTARCSTFLAADPNPGNDTMNRPFTVTQGPPPDPGWLERKPLPSLPSGKAVKDGGWLARTLGAGRIYAAKGNKTPDFFEYAPSSDSWRQLRVWPGGAEIKGPGKGSAGCHDGLTTVYATKGNNTLGFWKYDIPGDSWCQRRNIPLGPSNKKVKGGTDLACAADGMVYLLKGYKAEFYRYFPAGDSWRQLTDAPHGANPKWDKGSWLAYDGNRSIYAHKAKYHEFYRYDIQTQTWSPAALNAMPIPGSAGSKKSKDGGCGAWLEATIYALKGGNTQEFWQYFPAGDSWREEDTMPAWGTAQRRKKVKAGADITALSGLLYALKGNKTTEFWRYTPYPAAPAGCAPRDGVASSSLTIGARRLTISPNPVVNGVATVRFPSILPAPTCLGIYDATGRLVLESRIQNPQTKTAPLDLRSVPAGIYLARLTGSGFTETRKLVVRR